jgi:hypothetical protein
LSSSSSSSSSYSSAAAAAAAALIGIESTDHQRQDGEAHTTHLSSLLLFTNNGSQARVGIQGVIHENRAKIIQRFGDQPKKTILCLRLLDIIITGRCWTTSPRLSGLRTPYDEKFTIPCAAPYYASGRAWVRGGSRRAADGASRRHSVAKLPWRCPPGGHGAKLRERGCHRQGDDGTSTRGVLHCLQGRHGQTVPRGAAKSNATPGRQELR